eukprot:2269034-Pleurochrysis_carterae.AAC.1
MTAAQEKGLTKARESGAAAKAAREESLGTSLLNLQKRPDEERAQRQVRQSLSAPIPASSLDAVQPKVQGVIRGCVQQHSRGAMSQQRAIGVLRRQHLG